MKIHLNHITLGLFMLLTVFHVSAKQPVAPVLTLNTEGLDVSLDWSVTDGATNYRLFYAPYPYQGEQSIDSVDLGNVTHFSSTLWQHAKFYVAVRSYNAENQGSPYSNINFVQIEDRGEQYREFWRSTLKEIDQKTFSSDQYLYSQSPDTRKCFNGSLNEEAKNRELVTLNEIRKLHNLSAVQYDAREDNQVQSASLTQRSNDFLLHEPPAGSRCFSQEGFEGSRTGNISLGSQNTDPADDLIRFMDDAFNLSGVGSVGHRRWFLSPFLQYTSYGQVYGASAVKVFGFAEDKKKVPLINAPNFIAFPYLHYPYAFLSDKSARKKTPWSISIIEDKVSIGNNWHDFFANARVTVTQKGSDQVLSVQNLFSDVSVIGVPNNLSWVVDGWEYDTWYTVTVDNIHYQSGEVGQIEYDVFIDYKNIINLNYPIEAGDSKKSERLIEGELTSMDDKDSFEVFLRDGKVNFLGKSQFLNMGYYIELYNADKELLHASDKPFTLIVSEGQYTIVATNCYKLSCYEGNKKYNIQLVHQKQ
ncbi:MAG: hypothetical protein KAG19_06695 [Methylococcales bacterium]|nr:hypothetical protein [Methylococcales bacterium]